MSSTFRPACFEQLRHGEHRADAHLVGLAAGDREAAEHAERLQPFARRGLLAHHDAGAGAVGELAGVAGRDHAARDRRLDLRRRPRRSCRRGCLRPARRSLPSSTPRRSPCRRPSSSSCIGAISSSNLPASRAAAARCWLRTPYSSCARARCRSAWRRARRSAASASRSRACCSTSQSSFSMCLFISFCTHEIDLDAAGDEDVALAGDHALRGHARSSAGPTSRSG